MSKNIHDYIRTGYPAVAIATSDEDRTISAVTRAFLATHPDAPMWKIAATGGLVSLRPDPATGKAAVEPGVTYTPAFIKAGAMPSSLLIVLDFQHIIKNAAAYRGLRDALNTVKSANSMIVLIAPGWTMPAEVEHDIPLIHDGLPSREELSAALDLCVESTNAAMTADLRTAVLDSASGLTLAEAEGAMAMAFTGTTFDPAIVADEKMKLVRNSGYLEVSAPAKIGDLGGLGGLRTYCEQEILTVMHDPELRVRGVMLVGVPGTGKSLAARVLGAMMQYPVLRCDIAGLKGSHVGQSERQMRDALKLAEAVSPCVFYIDEIEKAVGGFASSANTDSGVTLGMVGILLTWLQEHKSQIITIATCNDYSKLPAELTRAGRFDERFFVDLPSASERADIAGVHLAKYSAPATCAASIAAASDGWTGAEIEQLVRSAARRTRRNITPEAITACAKDIKPISKVRAEEIKALRNWGSNNLRIANTVEAIHASAPKRHIAAAKSGMVVNRNLN